jgi:hypothetical protein
MFILTGMNVLAVGYVFGRRHPWATVVACALALAGLALWYRVVRVAEDEVRVRTQRRLALGVIVLVLVVPFLLRKLLGLS